MLTAKYNVVANEWTETIDAALAAWSKYVVGSVEFNVRIQYAPGNTYLAAQSSGIHSAGYAKDGTHIAVADAQAKLQGADTGNGYDFTLRINPDYKWAFGEYASSGKYHALSVVTHEIGHTLFAERDFSLTPFEMLMEKEPDLFDARGSHLADHSALMYTYMPAGVAKGITDLDLKIAGMSGLTTIGDDTVYIVGPKVDAGAGNDKAIWLGSLDSFASDLINFEQLVVSDVSAEQRDLFSLYEVGLNRAPDLDSFSHWMSQDLTFRAIADEFVSSKEFSELYQSREELLVALYDNALGRAPDAAGFNYWLNSSDSDADLLAHFASLASAPAEYMFTL